MAGLRHAPAAAVEADCARRAAEGQPLPRAAKRKQRMEDQKASAALRAREPGRKLP